jgi:hypothetical protein
MDKLEGITRALRERFGPELPLTLQTNGDLLDAERLGRILAMGYDRIDVVSLDRFHKHQGSHRGRLEELFLSRGMVDGDGICEKDTPNIPGQLVYRFWGANEDFWLGGNWARGRALETGVALLQPGHNFCEMWSGAKDFLVDGSPQQGVHIQLTKLYPCCPGTWFDLGDVREAPVEELMDRVRDDPDWQVLDQGRPHQLGAAGGLDPGYVKERIEALGDVCLWCDEYQRTRFEGPRGADRPENQRTPFDV